MKSLLRLVLLITLLPAVAAAQPDMIVEHYTKESGLPSNTVYCAQKDGDGFVWFGMARPVLVRRHYVHALHNTHQPQVGHAAAQGAQHHRRQERISVDTQHGQPSVYVQQV